jgi:ketosteroid isomerase-like protein
MHHVRRTALALAFACATALGFAQAPDVEALLSMSPTWEAHYNAGDLDALTMLYTEDAVLMPPDLPSLTGVDAMRAIVQTFFDVGLVGSEVPRIEAYGVMGDEAWGAGPFRFFDASGNLVVEGKYLVVYRYVDGAWRIARHMWSNDAPLPAPGG